MKICVMGAGSIGCHIGGRLAAAGADVTLIGRMRIGDTLRKHGLRITDYRGADLRVPPSRLQFSESATAAGGADLVLITVKSAATALAANALALHLASGTLVISFQNGLRNADVLRAQLPQCVTLAAMVPFNVINRGDGVFHQGSEGELEIERHARLAPLLPLFANAGLPLKTHADLLPVQWAKLLFNLNNPVNALSGMPLKAQLSQRDYRRCVALAQQEAFALLDYAGIRPARLTPLPARWIPRLMCVPDFLFARLASKMLAIDPLARSSMWEDLEAGRKTEIDWINGEIVHLAHSQNRAAPVNEKLVELVRDAENGGRRQWSSSELLALLLDVAH
jgi:2-dehydropantoate 2-reductase